MSHSAVEIWIEGALQVETLIYRSTTLTEDIGMPSGSVKALIKLGDFRGDNFDLGPRQRLMRARVKVHYRLNREILLIQYRI